MDFHGLVNLVCCYFNLMSVRHINMRGFLWEATEGIKMITDLEHPDLPQCDLLDDGVVLRLHKLLDGDDLPRVFVSALEDDAVGALSDLSDLLVLLHPQAAPADIQKGKTNTCLWGSQEAGLSLQRGDAGGVVSGANLTTWCFYVILQLKLE